MPNILFQILAGGISDGTRVPAHRHRRVARANRLHHLTCLLVLGCLFAIRGFAAQFTSSFDHETVDVGESTVLNLTFEDLKVSRPPQLPEIPNAKVNYVGPQSSFSIINGQASSSVTYRYMVTPQAPGEVRVPALSVTVDGNTFSSRPLVLKVSKGGVANGATGAGGIEEFIHLKVVFPREQVFYGETFPAEIRLYTAIQVRELNPPVPKLELDGFVLGKSTGAQQSQISIGNRQYAVLTWRMSATAAKLGTLNFGPAATEAVVQVPNRGGRRRDPFGFGMLDDFFGTAELRRLQLTSPTNTIRVVPLPAEGKPAEFGGAVGKFRLAVTASPTNVAVGEPITLRVQISGEGNFDTLSAPRLADTRGWKSYPPSSNQEFTDPLGLEGTKTFELVLEPENASLKAIPEIRFVYFDPEAKRYVTLRHPAIPVLIRPSATVQAAPSRQAVAGEPMTPAGVASEELSHIRTDPGMLVAAAGSTSTIPWLIALILIPLPAYAALAWVSARRERAANDPVLQRRIQATRAIQEGLERLRQQAAAGDGAAFFATLAGVLQERIGLTLGVPAAGITEEVIEDKLRPRGLPAADLDVLAGLYERINQARYAPMGTPAQLEELRQRAESVCAALGSLEVTR